VPAILAQHASILCLFSRLSLSLHASLSVYSSYIIPCYLPDILSTYPSIFLRVCHSFCLYLSPQPRLSVTLHACLSFSPVEERKQSPCEALPSLRYLLSCPCGLSHISPHHRSKQQSIPLSPGIHRNALFKSVPVYSNEATMRDTNIVAWNRTHNISRRATRTSGHIQAHATTCCPHSSLHPQYGFYTSFLSHFVFLRSVPLLLVTVNVLTRATRRDIREDAILRDSILCRSAPQKET
jgi:hypothetical protein